MDGKLQERLVARLEAAVRAFAATNGVKIVPLPGHTCVRPWSDGGVVEVGMRLRIEDENQTEELA